jgi:hypothetical protein
METDRSQELKLSLLEELDRTHKVVIDLLRKLIDVTLAAPTIDYSDPKAVYRVQETLARMAEDGEDVASSASLLRALVNEMAEKCKGACDDEED